MQMNYLSKLCFAQHLHVFTVTVIAKAKVTVTAKCVSGQIYANIIRSTRSKRRCPNCHFSALCAHDIYIYIYIYIYIHTYIHTYQNVYMYIYICII